MDSRLVGGHSVPSLRRRGYFAALAVHPVHHGLVAALAAQARPGQVAAALQAHHVVPHGVAPGVGPARDVADGELGQLHHHGPHVGLAARRALGRLPVYGLAGHQPLLAGGLPLQSCRSPQAARSTTPSPAPAANSRTRSRFTQIRLTRPSARSVIRVARSGAISTPPQ